MCRSAARSRRPLRGTAKVGIEALTAGAYEVSWTAVSEDGHVMKGHFGFTVAKAPDVAPAQ